MDSVRATSRSIERRAHTSAWATAAHARTSVSVAAQRGERSGRSRDVVGIDQHGSLRTAQQLGHRVALSIPADLWLTLAALAVLVVTGLWLRGVARRSAGTG